MYCTSCNFTPQFVVDTWEICGSETMYDHSTRGKFNRFSLASTKTVHEKERYKLNITPNSKLPPWPASYLWTYHLQNTLGYQQQLKVLITLFKTSIQRFALSFDSTWPGRLIVSQQMEVVIITTTPWLTPSNRITQLVVQHRNGFLAVLLSVSLMYFQVSTHNYNPGKWALKFGDYFVKGHGPRKVKGYRDDKLKRFRPPLLTPRL